MLQQQQQNKSSAASTAPHLSIRHNSQTYRHIPVYTNCDIQLQNVAPDDGLKSRKHVEHLMINKDTL